MIASKLGSKLKINKIFSSDRKRLSEIQFLFSDFICATKHTHYSRKIACSLLLVDLLDA